MNALVGNDSVISKVRKWMKKQFEIVEYQLL